MLHGITGHSMASYCKHMVKSATKRGFQCVVSLRIQSVTPLGLILVAS